MLCLQYGIVHVYWQKQLHCRFGDKIEKKVYIDKRRFVNCLLLRAAYINTVFIRSQ